MYDMMSNQQSIAAELLAAKDRVRFFIGDAHWGEDGRYKERLLSECLGKLTASNVAIGTGFIKNDTKITTQIDLIVYDSQCPLLFQSGDFVIVEPEAVFGIIEVKSNASNSELT
ncbi:hypothetical protein P0G10_18580 [Eubacteriales bacterium DFI.9.88]|nr:hypothetical protein [Eubacteriales bacterium DFI.9.88]